jgi:hypothetical protein
LFRFATFSFLQRYARSVTAAVHAMSRELTNEPGSGPERWRKPLLDSDRVLVSRTHVWLRDIPQTLRPKQLCRHFPRIANLIAENWDDRVLTDRVLNDLITDRRGNRAGFPPRVNVELHALLRLSLRRTGDKSSAAARRKRERSRPER